ncbi:MAG: hypothetical protein ACK4WF_00070 [Candidatus Brocadiales bacterium]
MESIDRVNGHFYTFQEEWMAERKENWQDMYYAFWSAFDIKRVLLGFLGMTMTLLWVSGILWVFSTVKFINTGPSTLLITLLQPPTAAACQLLNAFITAFASGNWKAYLPLAFMLLGLLAIWSLAGGAITRVASLDYAKGSGIGFKDSIKYSASKFWSYYWAPVAPMLGALFFVLLNGIAGLLGKIKFLEVLLVLGFPLILLFSFLTLFVVIIGVIGCWLMIPTIIADGTDAFDSMSRAYSYVLSQPIKYFTFIASAAVFGVFAVAIASTVADLLVQTSFATVGLGMGQKFQTLAAVINVAVEPEELPAGYSVPMQIKMAFSGLQSTTMTLTAVGLLVYLLLLKLLVWSVASAYVGSAQTVLYLLMRKEVDGTEVADIYVEDIEPVIPAPTGQKN